MEQKGSFGGFALFLVLAIGGVWAFFKFAIGVDLVQLVMGLF